MAQPQITGIRETQTIGPDRKLQQGIILTYMVGTDGPFTLTTNQNEISSGIAKQKMQLFANSLDALRL
jgi:hypothetical protein